MRIRYEIKIYAVNKVREMRNMVVVEQPQLRSETT